MTYSGVFDEVTGTILAAANSGKHTRDEDSENVPGEPPSKRNHYTDWPEGVLRSLCSERDISSFGEKSEVVARLIQFDAAEAERHGGADQIMPEAPEESAAPINKSATLTYTLQWPTLIIAFKQMVYKDTGIPVGQQRLQFGEGGPILQEASPDSPLSNWSHRGGGIKLYSTASSARQAGPFAATRSNC